METLFIRDHDTEIDSTIQMLRVRDSSKE